ncbi:MAG: hypothetical protein PW843_06885 [Azospirillaceae bacterium]|nr:hypothetical protein [Azospirillaceae bacterium]
MSTKPTKTHKDEGSILGNIILEEVVEAIEEARSPTPDIFPPIPHEAPKAKEEAGEKKDGHHGAEKKRPDSPGHHSR